MDMVYAKLYAELEDRGGNSKRRKVNIIVHCKAHPPPTPTKKHIPNVKREGLYGKPKGVFLILLE